MRVRSLGQEDPLEEGMATHSSLLAWRIPMDRGAWRATVRVVTKESDTTERLSTHTHLFQNSPLSLLFVCPSALQIIVHISEACSED